MRDAAKNKNFSEKTRILGIDPGTALVGWAILEENKGRINTISFGHISTPPEKNDSERILEISNDLQAILKKFRPQEAAIEKLFFFKNKKTVMNVSEARGAIILTLKQKNVTVFGYTPLQIKQAITGYGKASKKQVQEMTKKFLKLTSVPKPDDTADAIAVAICHIHSRRIKNLNLQS